MGAWRAELRRLDGLREVREALGLAGVESTEVVPGEVSWCGSRWEGSPDGLHLVCSWDRVGDPAEQGVLDLSMVVAWATPRRLGPAIDRAAAAWPVVQALLPGVIRPFDPDDRADRPPATPGIRLWPHAVADDWNPDGVWVSARSAARPRPELGAYAEVSALLEPLLRCADVVRGAVHGLRRAPRDEVWVGFAGEWIARRRLGAAWGPGWRAAYDLTMGGHRVEVKTTTVATGARLTLSPAEVRAAQEAGWRLVRVRLPEDAAARLREAPPADGGRPLDPPDALRLAAALGQPLTPPRLRAVRAALEDLEREATLLQPARLPKPLLRACADFGGQPGLELPFDRGGYVPA